MEIKPIILRDANRFVAEKHRHNIPTKGHKWSIGLWDNGTLVGVAIAGQPVARRLDDGETIEVRRVCTDGTRNACSMLYGRCARIAKEFGYKRIITYTLESEPGTSLKASGWKCCGNAGGGTWDSPSRPREVTELTIFGEEQKYPTERKVKWEKIL